MSREPSSFQHHCNHTVLGFFSPETSKAMSRVFSFMSLIIARVFGFLFRSNRKHTYFASCFLFFIQQHSHFFVVHFILYRNDGKTIVPRAASIQHRSHYMRVWFVFFRSRSARCCLSTTFCFTIKNNHTSYIFFVWFASSGLMIKPMFCKPVLFNTIVINILGCSFRNENASKTHVQ